LDLKEGKINVLLHGDAWKNNLMFHYNNINADAVTLLDFQIVLYNCFANDLQYFLFSSASAEVIAEHLDELLERYYNRLKSAAPERPDITLERVKKEFFERLYFGFLMTVGFRPVLMAAVPPDMEDIINGKEDDMAFRDERFLDDLKLLLPIFEKFRVF